MRFASHVLSAGALMIAATAAQAADLPSSKMAPVAPVFLAYNWTGFYVGAHAGAAFVQRNRGVDVNTYNTVAGDAASLGAKTAFIGGLQVGYNHQFSNFVLGVEADISYLGYRSRASTPASIALFGGDTIYQAKADWLGTARLRAGVAIDRALIYVTGGLAYSDLKYSVVDACIVAPCGGATINASGRPDWGWVLGGGLEYAITNNWTVKGEYLYASFRGRTVSAAAGPGAGGTFNFRFGRTDMHIARLGVNYKF